MLACWAGWGGLAVGATIVKLDKGLTHFLELSKGQGPSRQLELWDQLVEAPDREFYEVLVWNDKARKPARLREWIPELLRLEPRIKQAFGDFNKLVDTEISAFRQRFPDAKLDQPIYAALAPTFNGRTGTLRHRQILAFGLDSMLERGDDPNVLFAHELFHLYHAQHSGIVDDGVMSHQPLTVPLWTEGLATYASGLLNPSKKDGELLFEPELAQIPASKIPELARSFLRVAGKSATGDDYGTWFNLGAAKLDKDLPNRCGYLLGLNLVRRVAGFHSLPEMVSWGPLQVHRMVVAQLSEMAMEGAPHDASAIFR